MATIPDDLAARIVAALETIAETIVVFQQQFEERERKFAESKAKKREFGDKPFGGSRGGPRGDRGGFGGEKRPYKPRDRDDGGYGSDDFGGDDERPRRKSFGDKKPFGDKGPARGGPKGRDRFSGGGSFRDFDGPKKAGPKKPFKKKF